MKEELHALVSSGRVHVTVPLVHLLMPSHGATFVSSFPRSGNTWLRAVLCNLIRPEVEGDPRQLVDIIPGASFRNLSRIWRTRDRAIYKTHACYLRGIRRAVYLLRDGRDAVTSYFHYTTTRKGRSVPFERWFQMYDNGLLGPRWDQHVESWLTVGSERLGGELLIVHFERLKTDTATCVKEISSFLGIDASGVEIDAAIQNASLERSRAWERFYRGDSRAGNASFYRGGHAGGWSDLICGEIHDRFMARSDRALKISGYVQ